MTRDDIVKFLAEKDLDLTQLVKEVEQEKKERADHNRKVWMENIAEAEDYLLEDLITYIEIIFGETLTKEDIQEFKKGLNRMTEQLVKVKECGKPVVEPKVWIPKKDENEDFLKAFAKML